MAQTIKKMPEASPLVGHLRQGLRESALLLTLIVALYLLVSLLSFDGRDPAWSQTGDTRALHNLGGMAGAWSSDLLLYFLGYPALLIPPLLAIGGGLAYRGKANIPLMGERSLSIRALGFLLCLIASCGLAGLFLHGEPVSLPGSGAAGGVIGEFAGGVLVELFNVLGAGLLLCGLGLVGLNLLTGVSWLAVLELVGRLTLGLMRWISTFLIGAVLHICGWWTRRRESRKEARKHDIARRASERPRSRRAAEAFEDLESPQRIIEGEVTERTELAPRLPTISQSSADRPAAKPKRSPGTAQRSAQPETFDLAALPPMDLLDVARRTGSGYSREILETLSRQVEEKLADFGIDVEVVDVQPGPVITRFELRPAPGIKVSQITNLAKDLARGLSVIAVRVVEVIPGKSVVGLEIPNNKRETVFLSEVLGHLVYQEAQSPVTIGLGKDIAGKPVVANLTKMPHLLVAGTTGSGKSVAINAMLLSILYKSSPEQVRLILVDPKMLELSIYEGIPHLLAPVVTDMKDAQNALRWCVAEMERRYRLMATFKVRNIAGFNRKVEEGREAGVPLVDPFFCPDDHDEAATQAPALETLPFIVVVIDELADLMMVVGKKVEELIARLAQKARAAGIHLVLATQRPSVDVITGLIKANIPSRIAFQVSSKVDSRTILDQMGAETLLGHGDMLYLPPGSAFPQRLHGAFVDDHEVNAVVEFLKSAAQPNYVDDLLAEITAETPGVFTMEGEDDDGESDQLYDKAVSIVTESGRASASGIQRRLKIGYNRAARLIEAMEKAGIVSEQRSNGMREVLAPPPPEA